MAETVPIVSSMEVPSARRKAKRVRKLSVWPKIDIQAKADKKVKGMVTEAINA